MYIFVLPFYYFSSFSRFLYPLFVSLLHVFSSFCACLGARASSIAGHLGYICADIILCERLHRPLWRLSWFAAFCIYVHENCLLFCFGCMDLAESLYKAWPFERKVVRLGWVWCVGLSLFRVWCEHFLRALFRKSRSLKSPSPAVVFSTDGANWGSQAVRVIILAVYLEQSWHKCDFEYHKRTTDRNIFVGP